MNRLANIRIVLVRPIYGGNLGAVCRAMKNMGITDLALVSPEPTLNFNDAQTYAMHAVDVLDNRKQFDTVAAAVADCGLVAGTTARSGLYRSHAKEPRDWAPLLVEAAASGKIAVVFGAEDSGLTNEELAICTQVVRIPTSNLYSSINLSQAVMILCYELFLADAKYALPQERHPEAPSVMRERMFDLWRDMLRDIQFFKDDDMEEHLMMGIRRIFSRGKLSEADVNILMGIAKQAMWTAAKNQVGRGVPAAPGSIDERRSGTNRPT